MKRPFRRTTVAERWARINERSRADGCPCGEPATVIRRSGHYEMYRCEDHAWVNVFVRKGGVGPFTPIFPTPEEVAELRPWVSEPQPLGGAS